jgi:hypothetical protein
MEARPRAVELGGINLRAQLRARVHASRADLLPIINQAIERLRSTGQIEALLLEAPQPAGISH